MNMESLSGLHETTIFITINLYRYCTQLKFILMRCMCISRTSIVSSPEEPVRRATPPSKMQSKYKHKYIFSCSLNPSHSFLAIHDSYLSHSPSQNANSIPLVSKRRRKKILCTMQGKVSHFHVMTMIGTGAWVLLTTCSGWNVEIVNLSVRLGMTRMIFDTCPANLSKLVADVGKKLGSTT